MPEIIDPESIVQLKDLMKDGFADLVDTYATSADDYVLKIVEGYAEGNVKKIVDAAHPLKSASGNLGLPELSCLANSIEMAGISVISGKQDLTALADDVAQIEGLHVLSKAALKEQV